MVKAVQLYVHERTSKLLGKGGERTMKCTLCNEHIEDIDLQFGDAVEVDEEYWHAECYAEYFDEALETV